MNFTGKCNGWLHVQPLSVKEFRDSSSRASCLGDLIGERNKSSQFLVRCYNSQMLSSSEYMSFTHIKKNFNLGDLVLLIAGTHEQTLISD